MSKYILPIILLLDIFICAISSCTQPKVIKHDNNNLLVSQNTPNNSIKENQNDSVNNSATTNRSKKDIMKIIMQNLLPLKTYYNSRLSTNPDLSKNGILKMGFKIDQDGNVFNCTVLESSMNDTTFDATVKAKITRWIFSKCPNDTTPVEYPFIFKEQ